MSFTFPSFTFFSLAERERLARDAYNAKKAKIDDYRNIDPKSMNFYPMKAGKRFMIQNIHRGLYLQFFSSDSKFYWRPYDANRLNINEDFLFTYDPSTKYLISIGKKNRDSSLGQVALYYNGTRGHPEDIIEAHVNYDQPFEFARDGDSLYLKHIASGKYILPRKPRAEGGPDDSLQAIGSSDKFTAAYQCYSNAPCKYTYQPISGQLPDNARINIIYEGRGWKSAPHCTFKIEGERGTTTMGPSDDLKVDDIISLRGSTEMEEFLPGASLNSVSFESVFNWSSEFPEFRISEPAIWNMKTVPTKFRVVSVIRADGTAEYGIVRSYDRIVLERVGTSSKLTNDNGLLNEVQTGNPKWQLISQLSFRGQPIKYKDTVMLFFEGDSTKALTRNHNGHIHCTDDMYCTDPFYGIDNDALFDPEELSREPRVDPTMFPFFELPVKEFYKRYPLNMECVRRNHATSSRGEETSAWYNIYAPPGYASLGDFGFDFPRLYGSHASWNFSYWEKRSSKHILSWPDDSPYRILFVSLTNTYQPSVPTVKALTDRGGWIMDGNLQDCDTNQHTFGSGQIAITEPSDDQSFFSMGYTFSKEYGGWTVPEDLIKHYPDNLKAAARVRVYLLNKVFAQNLLADGVSGVPPGNSMFNGGVPTDCDYGMESTTYSSGKTDGRKIYHMFNGSSDQARGRPRKYYIIFPISKQFSCCRIVDSNFQEELQCGTRIGNGYLGNSSTTFDFTNKCSNLYKNYCKAVNDTNFKSNDCNNFMFNQIKDAGSAGSDIKQELSIFCGKTGPGTGYAKYPNVDLFPDLCSCHAPQEYLQFRKTELINTVFSMIKDNPAKLQAVGLGDGTLQPCKLMAKCRGTMQTSVPGLPGSPTRSVIPPQNNNWTDCSGSVCIQTQNVTINNSNVNQDKFVFNQTANCQTTLQTVCLNATYGPVKPDPINPLRYIRDKISGSVECDNIKTACELIFPPVDSGCVSGIRTLTYTYRGTDDDCKEAALDLTKRRFPAMEQYLLPLAQQPNVNTTDKTISIRSNCSACITNYTNPTTCEFNTSTKRWFKKRVKIAPTPATNGGSCNDSSQPSEIILPCDENKDCEITKVSDVCTNGNRTTTFNINKYESGNGKTCSQMALDDPTMSYKNPTTSINNNVLTITSQCINCTEVFNNPACVYDTATKTWKVTKTSTISPAQFGGSCNLQPRTIVEACPTNRDCEVNTSNIVDICNNETGVRTMKVDILKYSNGSGVSCEAKARQLMPGITNINKVNDSYVGQGSCTAFKDCELDVNTYNDVCDEMKGNRSMTINVLSETVGTGKKSCETVATEYVQGENPDIVIDEVSRDGNTVKITSTCSKRKFYMLIAIILVVIVLIVGGVLVFI